jgi:transmembrane sensor
MERNLDPTDISIARFIAGECTAAEAHAFEAALADSPSLRARVAKMRLVMGSAPTASSWNADQMWAGLRARSQRPAPSAAPRAVQRSLSGFKRAWHDQRLSAYSSAAAIVLVLGGAAALWLGTHGTHVQTAQSPEAAGHYSTTRGQYATIQLTDGTRVTLAPESRLTIPAAFGRNRRDISLDGEAIFDVKHDAAHAFRVHARGAQVEDIGTRFDLRAYGNEAAVTVAVAEGAVTLGRERGDSANVQGHDVEGIVLHRGDLGSLDAGGHAATRHSVRVAAYLGWASGRLSFVSRPLPEVLTTIGRWYDLDIRVPDTALASRLVTADFSTQSADEMIHALAIAVDANVERTARVVTLRAK